MTDQLNLPEQNDIKLPQQFVANTGNHDELGQHDEVMIGANATLDAI